jgi:hypothetical protein
VSQNPPVKPVLTDGFFDVVLHKRAQDNERLAAQGLPPRTDELWCISESDARILAADEAKRRGDQAAALVAPPAPTRGPLCRAAKAKSAERNASIPGFERHSRKCQICRHPYYDSIEASYLNWENVVATCRYFQLADADTIYRHARAAGLDVIRRQNVRVVIERFIEKAADAKVTVTSTLRSIRALSCLDDKGRWTDLPKTHILRRGPDASPAASPDDDRSSDSGLPEDGLTSTTNPPPISHASPPSTEEDEPSSTAVTAPSTERSEPCHDNDTGFLKGGSAAVSRTSSSENESSVLSHPSIAPSEPWHDNDTGFLKGGSAAVTSTSTERSEPCRDSGLPKGGSSSSTETLETLCVAPARSIAPSELERQGTASAVPKSWASSGVLTPEAGPSERSTSFSQNESSVVPHSPTERSEPHRENSSLVTCHSSPDSPALSNASPAEEQNVPSSDLEPPASSVQPPDPNRVSMGN